jgi:transcriptional regulator with XRE-family HTH domain
MRAGLSGVELSRRSGVSSPGISLYEWSERRARPETIIKLARALRVEPGVLVRKPEEKEEE